MSSTRRVPPTAFLVSICIVAASSAIADEPASSKPIGAESNAGMLTVRGKVLMRDGSPAAGAVVRTIAELHEPPKLARADEAGRFEFRGVFGNGARLHASSADGVQQTTLQVPAVAVRSSFGSPITLTLAPAIAHEVVVSAAEKPAAGAHVAAAGSGFKVEGVTGEDGKAKLMLPANDRLREVVAWHPKLGVNGVRELEKSPPRDSTGVSLLAPGPHTIRVIDLAGKPIAGVELGVSFHAADSGWIIADRIDAARVKTDAQGAATIAWAPREKLKYVGVSIVGSHWKIAEIDLARIAEGTTTVRARREKLVEGRLVLPADANPEGILITGFGFGPVNGDIPYSRARRDGSFTLRVFSDHAYVLGIADLEWACDLWSGVILAKDTSEPAEIRLAVYPATPLTVRVTRGPARDPVANAWVYLSSFGEVKWIDAGGKRRSGRAGVSGWLWTDADGFARTGVNRGEHQLRLGSGDWNEERTIKVTSKDRVEVEFYRPWYGKRHIVGRLLRDGMPFQPSSALTALAWTQRSMYLPVKHDPKVHSDGTFELAIDEDAASLLFIDREKHRSGFLHIGQTDATVDVTMEASAVYSGILLDPDGQPLAHRTLGLYEQASRNQIEAIVAPKTDLAGRFRFDCVPANVPLTLGFSDRIGGPKYFLFERLLFEPGELRENARVKTMARSPAPSARTSRPLGDRVKGLCRDARLMIGMRALVVLLGDDSSNVVKATDRLLDADTDETVLRYLPMRVNAGDIKTDAAFLAERDWPRPASGEIVLLALNDDEKPIAIERIATDDPTAAASLGAEFLKKHLPPVRNALTMRDEARTEAKRSGRRVWIVESGPRCGPCILLARWMEDQHATLEKDFVILKVVGLEEHLDEVLAELPEKRSGIPWHAITDSNGKILVSSESPIGNTGYPGGSVESLRHFRGMLDQTVQKLKPDDVERLIKSFPAEE